MSKKDSLAAAASACLGTALFAFMFLSMILDPWRLDPLHVVAVGVVALLALFGVVAGVAWLLLVLFSKDKQQDAIFDNGKKGKVSLDHLTDSQLQLLVPALRQEITARLEKRRTEIEGLSTSHLDLTAQSELEQLLQQAPAAQKEEQPNQTSKA